MARSSILPTDPQAVKVWSAQVAQDSRKKTYFNKMTGKEGSSMPVVTKTALESGAGDEVTTTLIAKLRGKPVEGPEKLAGRAQKLSSATHKMRIDKHRQAVNCGDAMDQKRVNWNIQDQAKARLADWVAEVFDEQVTMNLAGSRGVGGEIQQYPVGYAGFPNALVGPDATHYMCFDGTRAGASALTAGDKMQINVVEKLVLRAKRQLGGIDSPNAQAVRMEPVSVEGGEYFVLLLCPESMYDLRRETGEAGWLAYEKAKVTAVGAKSPLFTGGSVLFNGVLIDETQTCVKFDTTVANNVSASGTGSADTSTFAVNAARNLFLGANACAVAFGTKGQKDGMRFELTEDDDDYGEEGIVIIRMVAGFSKTRFTVPGQTAMDFGVIANDVAFTVST